VVTAVLGAALLAAAAIGGGGAASSSRVSFNSLIASKIRKPALTARSASSSCATGAPNTAITASPTNFSTVPPCPSTTSRNRA
jgi:hypothetical protein